MVVSEVPQTTLRIIDPKKAHRTQKLLCSLYSLLQQMDTLQSAKGKAHGVKFKRNHMQASRCLPAKICNRCVKGCYPEKLTQTFVSRNFIGVSYTGMQGLCD